MDAYLTSRDLASADHFYLNINFELLNGCKFSCRGCYVEKNSQTPITQEQFVKLNKLIKSFKDNLYSPFIAFVGPTDFLAAENFEKVFDDPSFVEMFHNFKRLSLQTTYLGMKNVQKSAEILKKNFSDLEIEINIVIDPGKIMDDIYLKVLEKNKTQFLGFLGRDDIKTFGVMNVYDYSKTKIADLLQNYDFIHNRVAHLVETTVDYNFSAGRKVDLTNGEFLDLADRLKLLYDSSELSENKEFFLKADSGKTTDSLIERQYNYRGGEIYHSPLLYERFVNFRESFRIPLQDHSVSEVEQYDDNLQISQYRFAEQTEECATCPFLTSCVNRGILHLMETFDTKKCLVAKNALFAINTMGALPLSMK